MTTTHERRAGVDSPDGRHPFATATGQPRVDEVDDHTTSRDLSSVDVSSAHSSVLPVAIPWLATFPFIPHVFEIRVHVLTSHVVIGLPKHFLRIRNAIPAVKVIRESTSKVHGKILDKTPTKILTAADAARKLRQRQELSTYSLHPILPFALFMG